MKVHKIYLLPLDTALCHLEDLCKLILQIIVTLIKRILIVLEYDYLISRGYSCCKHNNRRSRPFIGSVHNSFPIVFFQTSTLLWYQNHSLIQLSSDIKLLSALMRKGIFPHEKDQTPSSSLILYLWERDKNHYLQVGSAMTSSACFGLTCSL